MQGKQHSLPWFLSRKALEVYITPKRYYVCLDFETTSIDRGSALNMANRIVLACWHLVYPDGQIIRKHRFADEYDLGEMEQDIKDADFVVAHNAKFELQWLKRCGLELRDILVFDTMLAEWVIGGNRYGLSDLGLEQSASRYQLGSKLPLAGMMIKLGVCPSVIPEKWLLDYCHMDVELCRQLYERQRKILQENDLLHLALTRNLTCACLADIEFNGCELDRQAVASEYDRTIQEFQLIENDLVDIAGDTNLSSSKQLAELLYGKLRFTPPIDPRTKEPIRTGKGAYSTRVETLDKLVAKTAAQKEFLAKYKRRNKLTALLTKNLEFFRGIVEERNGVFYGILNQGFTKTHRLSSSGKSLLFAMFKKVKGAQLQNLPREYKKLFTAHNPDYLIGEADGAQLEFRVAAELGQDSTATQEIIDGADVHAFTAKVLSDAGEPTTRQQAKASTFAPLYGGGGRTPAGKAYAKFFKEKYSGIAKTQLGWAYEVLEKGYLVTPYGMRFYWPGTKMSKSGYIDNTTSIYNFPVQGFATAEIIPIALIYFWHRSRELPIVIFNTIHDSIISRVHKDYVEEYEQLSKRCLTTDVYDFLREVYRYDFKVPLGVGVKVSKNWGTADVEKVWSVWPSGEESYKEKT